MQQKNVPIDFFSWHIYCTEPQDMCQRASRVKELLDKYGYGEAESILNEWNYVIDWEAEYVNSLKAIHGIKGAAFTMACISSAQHTSIDMLMYYDTRPSVFCGAFDYYTYEKLKGYYPLYWYGKFYDSIKEIPAQNKIENIYSLCGVDADGKILSVITHYTDDDTAENKNVNIDFGKKGNYEIYLLDAEHNGEYIKTTNVLEFDMPNCSAVLIKEI